MEPWSSLTVVTVLLITLYLFLKKVTNGSVGNIKLYGPKGALAAGDDFNKNPLETLRDAHKRHGSIFALNLLFFKAVFLLGPKHFRRIISSPYDELNLAAGVKTYLKGIFGVDISTVTAGTQEDFHRNISTSFNSKTNMDGFIHAMTDEIDQFWESVADNGPIDVFKTTVELVALINLRCFLGKETRDRIGEEFKRDWPQFEVNGVNPATIFLHWIPFLPSVRRTKFLRKKIAGWVMDAIQRRRDELEKNPEVTHLDYLQCVMKNLSAASDANKCLHLMSLLFAGEVNTAGSVGWGIAFMLTHPQEFAKLRDDIENCIGDTTEHISFSDLRKMEYTTRAIREILRLRQAALTMRMAVRDVSIDDKIIPKNTMVFGYPRFQNMDPEAFKEPERFNPDRFLTEDSPAFLPFGAGRHPCLGEQFALMVDKLAWAKLFTKYNVELLNKDLPEPQWDNALGVTIVTREPIRISITRKK